MNGKDRRKNELFVKSIMRERHKYKNRIIRVVLYKLDLSAKQYWGITFLTKVKNPRK